MDQIIHIKGFCEGDFEALKLGIPWRKVPFFKRHVFHYDFSSDAVNRIISQVKVNLGRDVKGAFLNYYENGNEYAPFHADKYESDSVLISFGTSRILRFKHNTTKENTDFVLDSGDYLYVPDCVNNDYKHSLLKRTKITEGRISILIFLV